MHENDVKYMQEAILEAKKAGPEVYPNPKVGAVIVFNGSIVSKGHTQRYGGDHAEVDAIKKLDRKYKNCTLYVTLEPCSHKGKTDPCTDIIDNIIFKRIVIANKDINPKASNGSKLLSMKGIKVSHGVCSEDAKKVNRRFFTFFEKKRPYIILKIASTLNGNIAELDGSSEWITNKDSRNSNYKMRSNCDAIMVGTKTILKDNPTLTSHGFGRDPKIVLIDMGEKLSKKENVFNHNPIVFSDDILGKNPINNIEIILKMLYKKSIQSLFIEGGGETISYFIDANLFDELQIYYAPKLIGKGRPLYKGLKSLSDNIALKINKIERFGDDIKITYHK